MQTRALTQETKTPTLPVEKNESPRVRALANIAETDEAYAVALLVPGVAKEAVELEVEQNVLRVRAESRLTAPEGLRARLHEFGGVTYERRFTLPEDVDVSAIEARLDNGLLNVVLPKREEVKPRTIAIA